MSLRDKSGLSNSIKPGGAYVSSYPYLDLQTYEVPIRKMYYTGYHHEKRRWLRWTFDVIRFGVKRPKRAEKPFVVGLNQGAKHTLTWHPSPSLGMVWRITGLYYIHVGPPGPKAIWKTENGVKRHIASLGCIEPIGNDAWGRFQRIVAYTCTGERTKGKPDLLNAINKRISKSGKLKMIIDSAPTPKRN